MRIVLPERSPGCTGDLSGVFALGRVLRIMVPAIRTVLQGSRQMDACICPQRRTLVRGVGCGTEQGLMELGKESEGLWSCEAFPG